MASKPLAGTVTESSSAFRSSGKVSQLASSITKRYRIGVEIGTRRLRNAFKPHLSKDGSCRRSHRVFSAYFSILSDESTEYTSNPFSSSNTESTLLELINIFDTIKLGLWEISKFFYSKTIASANPVPVATSSTCLWPSERKRLVSQSSYIPRRSHSWPVYRCHTRAAMPSAYWSRKPSTPIPLDCVLNIPSAISCCCCTSSFNVEL